MRIHCLSHPWNSRQFEAIARGISPNAILTESMYFKHHDTSGLMRDYYRALEKGEELEPASDLESDMILRCRLLRNLRSDVALQHLRAMQSAVAEVMNRNQAELVLSLTVDSFVLDAFRVECDKRRVPFVGLVASFVNGYVRLTNRGEHRKCRAPGSEEVMRVAEKLRAADYSPGFVRAAARRPKVQALRNWARMLARPAHFALLRRLTGDRWNTHYWTSEVVSRQLAHIVPDLSLGNVDWLSCCKASSRPIIFLPLQQVPEATVDYWCVSQAAAAYEKSMLRLIEGLRTDFHFLVKEHPNVWGFRHPSLYKSLRDTGAVTFCPAGVPAPKVLDHVDATLVWTGSVGFESALRGIPTLTMGQPYYCSGPRFMDLVQTTTAAEIATHIQHAQGAMTDDERFALVEHLLSGLVPGTFRWASAWDCRNEAHQREADELGAEIARILQT